MVDLKKDELEMLDGVQGRAKQRAMELLVDYADALGAEKFVDTNNVHLFIGFHPYPEVIDIKDPDQLVSKFFLDTDERIVVDRVETFNTTHIWAMDLDRWELMDAPESLHKLMELFKRYCIRTGISITSTCTPYQVGNVPTKGEHCAWTESSAVPFCNAVLGARTNTETAHSAFPAALTGKIPYSGFHIPHNRLGTHRIEVQMPVETIRDWYLMGYYIGEVCQLSVPVYLLPKQIVPSMSMLKSHNSAVASSGGVMMYHVVGVTPEAATAKEAFGDSNDFEILPFGPEHLRIAYENLNSAKDHKVDLINIGCPHYSLEQLRDVAYLLDGKKIHPDLKLWIWTAYQLRSIAERNGYLEIIEKAGGQVFTDSCPLNTDLFPVGTRVVATDSAKHAHYAPAIGGVDVWFGTQQECINAAVSGQWKGEL